MMMTENEATISMILLQEPANDNATQLAADIKKNSRENNAMTSSSSGYSSNRVPLPQMNMINNNNNNMGKELLMDDFS